MSSRELRDRRSAPVGGALKKKYFHIPFPIITLLSKFVPKTFFCSNFEILLHSKFENFSWGTDSHIRMAASKQNHQISRRAMLRRYSTDESPRHYLHIAVKDFPAYHFRNDGHLLARHDFGCNHLSWYQQSVQQVSPTMPRPLRRFNFPQAYRIMHVLQHLLR